MSVLEYGVLINNLSGVSTPLKVNTKTGVIGYLSKSMSCVSWYWSSDKHFFRWCGTNEHTWKFIPLDDFEGNV